MNHPRLCKALPFGSCGRAGKVDLQHDCVRVPIHGYASHHSSTRMKRVCMRATVEGPDLDEGLAMCWLTMHDLGTPQRIHGNMAIHGDHGSWAAVSTAHRGPTKLRPTAARSNRR